MTRRLVWLTTVAFGALTATSCGNANGLYAVHGKVLCDGQPAVGATVSFHRRNAADAMNEHTPQGVVGEDGSFHLASPAGDGARPGEYDVLIEWKEGAGHGRAALRAPDRFQGRYLNLQNPRFQAEVKSAANDLPPFELGEAAP
jgi:hypothetical protein